MSSSTIQKLKKFLTASGGACGCGQKATDVIQPQPKPKSKLASGRSKSAGDGGGSPHFFQESINMSPCAKIHESFAVVKESEDPYNDFRQSMLQMILEKEMYSRNDLEQLLECFLQLNSEDHHEVILRAFMELWNGGILPPLETETD